jgi:hypothetical protein
LHAKQNPFTAKSGRKPNTERKEMNTKHFSKLPLKKGEVIKLTRPKGRAIKVDSGQIWITQSSSAVDTFVEAGDSYFVREDGMLVAEAMTQTMLSTSCPQRIPDAKPQMTTSLVWNCKGPEK